LKNYLYVLLPRDIPAAQTEYQATSPWRATAHAKCHMNAFGSLEFIKRTKDTTTRVRVHIDRARSRTTPNDERGQASVTPDLDDCWRLRGQWAVVGRQSNRRSFAPNSNYRASRALLLLFGPEAQLLFAVECDGFRGGSVRRGNLVGRLSSELAKTKPGLPTVEGPNETHSVPDDDPAVVCALIGVCPSRYGLPVGFGVGPPLVYGAKLKSTKGDLRPLLGLGCSPVLVRGKKQNVSQDDLVRP